MTMILHKSPSLMISLRTKLLVMFNRRISWKVQVIFNLFVSWVWIENVKGKSFEKDGNVYMIWYACVSVSSYPQIGNFSI